jgi:hypothetical protein
MQGVEAVGVIILQVQVVLVGPEVERTVVVEMIQVLMPRQIQGVEVVEHEMRLE